MIKKKDVGPLETKLVLFLDRFSNGKSYNYVVESYNRTGYKAKDKNILNQQQKELSIAGSNRGKILRFKFEYIEITWENRFENFEYVKNYLDFSWITDGVNDDVIKFYTGSEFNSLTEGIDEIKEEDIMEVLYGSDLNVEKE